ncbi:RluA family pseudouridine synthase [Bacillus sp. FSL K6-3431]|uniref:RluA family pseudouridine synthase n=1 Tax=Bacillus sp. FSL K6-3431 TaxID=2921500 RepID=UPI0030F57812
MLKQQQECTINVHVYDQWSGMSIQSLFRTQWLAPKKLVHQLRMEKRVSVNDSLAIWTAPLEAGDDIFITFPNELNNTIIPFKTTIQIVYEDEHLLIVNKPAGMATHVNEQNEMDTLANAVAFYLQGQNDNRKIRHIHRLDKETTGAIIFAKHALSHAILDQMLENNEIDRTYLALTDGLMKKSTFTIRAPIGRDRHHPTRRRVSETGQQAVTHCKILKTIPEKQLSFIECKLATGRTHQIRVHMAHIGFPLAGDQLYGGRPIFQRQALHARKLAFVHPFTLKRIDCTAPFLDKPYIFEPFVKR